MSTSTIPQIVVLGATGQLGRALLAQLGSAGRGLNRREADLADVDTAIASLERIEPSALINAAAYTQVDRAEAERDLALKINAEAPAALARWSRQRDIPFVHYSTDYVFSDGDAPRRENDRTAPINSYGHSKLEGEKRIAEQGGRHLIFRTSWVYDADGINFVNTMLRLGAQRERLNVVDDQIGAPTFAKDLAEGSLKALSKAMTQSPFPSGIYHLTNSGETSWYGFAKAIFELARAGGANLAIKELRAIPSSDYPTPAARPKNSRLSNEKFRSTFGFALRPWGEALNECLKFKGF